MREIPQFLGMTPDPWPSDDELDVMAPHTAQLVEDIAQTLREASVSTPSEGWQSFVRAAQLTANEMAELDDAMGTPFDLDDKATQMWRLDFVRRNKTPATPSEGWRCLHHGNGCKDLTCRDSGRWVNWPPASREARLETALRDLLGVISTDDLIPESVSYMRQAREALAAHPKG